MTVTSQNGYPANNIGLTKVWPIPGTDREVRLRKGDTGYLLVHFAAWFDANIERIDTGQLDDWGYAERPIRGSSTELSNHASGTAIDLNAIGHPLGKSGTFTRAQTAAIRKQLKEYEGCIRWGGDYKNRKDEMHFEINADSDKVAQVAKKVRAQAGPVTPPKPKPIETPAIDKALELQQESRRWGTTAREAKHPADVLAQLNAAERHSAASATALARAKALILAKQKG